MKKENRSISAMHMSWFPLILLLVIGGMSAVPVGWAETAEDLDQKIRSRDTSFYRDFFDSILYERFAQWLRLDQIGRNVTFQKTKALDVNVFDEVPDSGFFVNRHGAKRLSRDHLKRGPQTGDGPAEGEPWRILKGKMEGVSTGFFIEDSKGDSYLLKFDPKDNPEMTTSAEIISHKFFHAFGYHVAEYYLVQFSPDQLSVDPSATYYDGNGFKKPITPEALAELLDRVPKFKAGELRASASKILPSPRKGYMDLDGRRPRDPADLIPHEDRRSIRALRVFASWLNHYDLRKGNTMDIVTAEDGQPFVKHYLIDFGSTLGSAASHPKPPVAGHEHIVDWYEIGEGIPTLKLTEKPWEKRWDQAGRQIAYPELGYFDNYQFHPGEWKTQLPYEAFDRLTVGDAFWAAKILMSFTDEDIRTVVESAEYSSPEISKIVSDLLIARRDLIGRYWFGRVVPLDEIRLSKTSPGTVEIRFIDLSVQYGFAQAGAAQYRYQVISTGPGGREQVAWEQEFSSPSFSLDVSRSEGPIVLNLQAKHAASDPFTEPPLQVTLAERAPGAWEIAEIDHGI